MTKTLWQLMRKTLLGWFWVGRGCSQASDGSSKTIHCPAVEVVMHWCFQARSLPCKDLDTLNSAQGYSTPPRKLLQRPVCAETGSLPPHHIADSVKHGLLAWLSSCDPPKQSLWVQTIASLSRHTWSCWCPPLLAQQHRQGGGSGVDSLLPSLRGSYCTHCQEGALAQPGDRTGHTSLQPGMGPCQQPSTY